MNRIVLAANTFEKVGHAIVGVMAVAGAYLIGNWLTWFFLGGIAHLVFRKSIAPGVMKFLRILGGAVLAIAVATFVFGEGGFGWGPGDQKKGDTGAGIPEKKDPDKKIEPVPAKKEDPLKNKENEGPPDDSVKVVVLGGNASEERFYLFQNEREPRTLSEIRTRILDLREKSIRPLKMVDIYVYKNSADRNGTVVKRLENWAREERFGVSFPPVQNENRPE